MPELPEVETIRRAIEPYLSGNTVKKIIIRRDNCRYVFDKQGLRALVGYNVTAVERRGKLMHIHLQKGDKQGALFIHLGMSGQIRLIKPGDLYPDYAKHDHLIIKFTDDCEIRFNDARRFGWVDVAFDDDIKAYPFLHKLGIEPLAADFTKAALYNIVQKSQSHIKATLLNQKHIAGLGNIYVCEALYKAKIHPNSQSLAIPRKNINILHGAIIEILEKAIESGGSSIKDHRTADGNLGYFQYQFAVYGKENEQCPNCQSPCIGKITQNGRSSFYCKNQQKIYKSA